jgi:hypothetical protein
METIYEMAKNYAIISGKKEDVDVFCNGALAVLKMKEFKRIPEPKNYKGSYGWNGSSNSIDWEGVPSRTELLVLCNDGSYRVLEMTKRKSLGNILVDKSPDGYGKSRNVEIWLGCVKSWRVLNPKLK